MSMKLHNYSPQEDFVPSKVTGELADFFVHDMLEPATREAEILRAILEKRVTKKRRRTVSQDLLSFYEVATSSESDGTE